MLKNFIVNYLWITKNPMEFFFSIFPIMFVTFYSCNTSYTTYSKSKHMIVLIFLYCFIYIIRIYCHEWILSIPMALNSMYWSIQNLLCQPLPFLEIPGDSFIKSCVIVNSHLQPFPSLFDTHNQAAKPSHKFYCFLIISTPPLI